jgi:hypothetical protein
MQRRTTTSAAAGTSIITGNDKENYANLKNDNDNEEGTYDDDGFGSMWLSSIAREERKEGEKGGRRNNIDSGGGGASVRASSRQFKFELITSSLSFVLLSFIQGFHIELPTVTGIKGIRQRIIIFFKSLFRLLTKWLQ